MNKPKFVPGDVILEVQSKINLQKIILRKDTLELLMGTKSFIFDLDDIQNITPIKGNDGVFTVKPAQIRVVGQSRDDEKDGIDIWEILFQHNQNDEITELVDAFYEMRRTWKKQQQIDRAKEREKALDYDSAIEIWEKLGDIKEAARVRKLKAEMGSVKIAQSVVQGDQITEIKDSVVSKSNIGGGSSKMQELKELTEMKKEGLIDDDEFKQMKKEILGK